MKAMYLDCFCGISGNMLLGALIDAGFPIDILREELEKLNLGKYDLINVEVTKCGIRANYFDVDVPFELPKKVHVNKVGEKHKIEHRTIGDIRNIIENSTLSAKIKHQVMDVFTLLGNAEAKVHGTTLEEVHFHEVGAIDTIIDVVGVMLGLEFLCIEKIYIGSVATGFGWIECAHGTLPVPAPATSELLTGLPCVKGSIEKELTTPTGAALLQYLAEVPHGLPLREFKIYYGAGKMDLPIPNVLRCYIGEEFDISNEQVYEVSCNIDDCTGEVIGYVINKLIHNGALDAWAEQIVMKKSRPGVKLCFLCKPEEKTKLDTIVLKETTTFGIRFNLKNRYVLHRKKIIVNTKYGPISVKIGRLSDGTWKFHPEHEDCQKLADEKGVSLRVLMRQAIIETEKMVNIDDNFQRIY